MKPTFEYINKRNECNGYNIDLIYVDSIIIQYISFIIDISKHKISKRIVHDDWNDIDWSEGLNDIKEHMTIDKWTELYKIIMELI